MIPVIFIAKYAIQPGEVEAFRQFLDELVNALEASDRSALAVNAYLNEEGTEAAIVQISSDPDSIKHYWRTVHQAIWTIARAARPRSNDGPGVRS